MALPVNVKIELDGKELQHYAGMKIWQDVFRHHRFEVLVPFEMLEESEQHFFSESHKVCGKKLSISFKPDFIYTTQEEKFDFAFKGIITSISLHTTGNMDAHFVIGGYSPTILMEDQLVRKIFHKMKVSDVVRNVTSIYPSNVLKSDVSATTGEPPYIVQYNETNYQFLRRLANEYGKWFYYDGTQIVFGDAKRKVVPFKIDGMQGFDVSLMLQPSKFNMSAYVYGDDQMTTASGTTSVSGLNPLGQFALDESDKLFSRTAEFRADKVIFDATDLDERAKIRRSMIASSLMVFQGIGERPNITVGDVVEVSGSIPSLGGRAKYQDFGKYIVTEIIHTVDENGNYDNKFKAIPESLSYPPPNQEVVAPIAHPEVATVTDNQDPEKMGRVKVRFFWPGNDCVTDWIRVSTFHTGGGDGLGMHFIPEVNAQVIVGYEMGHPEYPFVMNSVYPKTSDVRTAASQNEEKYIQTYAGNQISFNDANGSQKIEITNVNNADTAITLEFAQNGIITIKTKGEVNINADDAINIETKKKLTIKAMDIDISATNGLKIESKSNTEIKALQLKMEAQTVAALKGGAMVKVEGAMAEVKASGITTIGGAMVKIN